MGVFCVHAKNTKGDKHEKEFYDRHPIGYFRIINLFCSA